jgi:hydrogenase-4 membrane subunit HyfE
VSPLLVALLGVLLIPLFVATWRMSLFGLGCQGFLMAAVAYRLDPSLSSTHSLVTLIDLVLVRGLVVPISLYTVLVARRTPARNDVIPPNLLSWTLALVMVLLSFNLAELLVGQDGDQQTLAAVASTGVMLGFLVLSTQSGPFSQMIGVLRIENAIALLELGGERHGQPLGVQLGLLGIFVVTVALIRWYLRHLSPQERPESVMTSGAELPTV